MKSILSLLAIIAFVFTLAGVGRAQKSDDDGPMMRAIAEMQAGRNDKAIAALTEVIKLEPNNADAYFLRSNLRTTAGDAPGALADLSKAIELKPAVGAYYYNRAIVRLIGKDSVGAVKDLDLAVTNNYKIDPVLTLRAQLRMEQGDVKGALEDFNEAIRLNPNNPRSYSTRSELLWKLGKAEGALADLDYLLAWYETDPTKRSPPKTAGQSAKPANEQANLPRPTGSTKQKKDSETLTVEVASETVNESPADNEMVPVIAGAYLTRGLIYRSRGKRDAAIADFTKSIRMLPGDAWAYFYRALELEGKGDLAGALSDVSKAIEIEPRNGNLLVEQGVILLLQGKNKEAQVVFDMLLKSDSALWQKRIDERIAAAKENLPIRAN